MTLNIESFSQAPLATVEEDGDDLPTEAEDIQTRCGYRKWRPKCLQTLNRPCVLLACIAFYSLSLGFVVNGVINVNASSLERRFDLQSTDIGFISSSYDITAAFLAVVVGYAGSGQRKARMVALAIFCSALGSLVLSSPHFFSDDYSLGLQSPDFLCHTDQHSNETCASNGKSPLSNYFYFFLAGQLLHGVGGTTMFTVGISLIDDCVMPNRTPLFLGIIYGCNILGAGMGYLIGGQLLNLYVDFDSVSDVKLSPKDPRWVGAWWLGPLISAVAQVACALPLSLFGSELPSCKKVRQLRQNQAHMASSMHLPSKLGGLKFLIATFRVLKNPCFVFMTLTMVMEGMCMTGLAVFLPKFVENQFGTTAANAALYTGCAVIPAAAGGLVLGGWIAKRCRLNITQSIKMIIGLAVVSLVCSGFIWIKCDHKKIFGVQFDYSGSPLKSDTPKTLVSSCNAMCNCNTDIFEPVCGNGTELYFSPCHAGCTSKKGNEYSDCACLTSLSPNLTSIALKYGGDLTLTSGSCAEPCSLIYLFIVLLFIMLCLCFMPIAPADAIQLRCVHEDYKTHAQGVKTFIVRTLGSFVGPIVVGKLLDTNCNIWRKKCGSTLSCWLYDHDMLVTSLHVFIMTCKALSITLCCLALKFYHSPVQKSRSATEAHEVRFDDEVVECEHDGDQNGRDTGETAGTGASASGLLTAVKETLTKTLNRERKWEETKSTKV